MRIRFALVALALFLLPAVVHADPLVVTGGSTRTFGGFGGRFTLTGENFILNGGTGSGVGLNGRAFAGESLSFGAAFTGDADYGSGSAQFNGVSYPDMYYAGLFVIGGSVVVPLDAPASGSFILTAPFSFNANLRGCATNSFVLGPCRGGVIFDTTFTGQGIATLQLSAFLLANGTTEYTVNNATYQFAAPVPEPATLLLLSTGLAGVVGAARRRRKAKNRVK